MKRILLIVASAVAFLVGYGTAAEAWPGVPDRTEYRGYFSNVLDTQGDRVLQNGIPGWVVDAESFIGFIKDRMYYGSSRDSIGAQFIIQTMLGAPWSRNHPPSSDEIADWESRVRASGSAHTNWNINYTFTVNSYWQGNGTGPNPNDDAFYYETATRASIVFYNDSGIPIYAIKRDCGNPVINGSAPGLRKNWAATGYTVLDYGTANPGQKVHFWHYIWNYGLTGARIWWIPYDGASGAPTGLAQPNSNNFVNGQETVNVYNEEFTIPSNAAAGTKYCRALGWDPVNSAGQRDGRGEEECVTVVIPAKLKAAMSANPKTMAAGDTTSFKPSVSATSNASPITVQCSITRTLYPPAGGSSNLGNQPCVTASGDPNIVIGMGASVTLRSNDYAAPDTIAIGTRVCDVITITNPSGASYYDNYPADQTATDCVTIAKSPYVQFIGDVWAGGGFAAVPPGTCKISANITTVTRSKALSGDGTTPGSGTTYGAFALGKITNFGSASMARVATSGIGDNWTFSNINSGNLGYFGAAQHCIPDYVATYTSSPALAPGTIDVGGGVDGAWRVGGNSTIHGTMAAGRQKVYVVSGDVTIDNNVLYPATFASVGDIPSLVVIATGNIFIRSNVTQMDGIFIARGTVYTCHPKVEPATINTCNSKLTINGSVSSSRLDLFRTAGADGNTPTTQKAAAEVFNLSPEVYLKNSLNLNAKATLNTAAIRELPPRF
jgi:hypothetical protein